MSCRLSRYIDFSFISTHSWYNGGYLLSDGHRGDALVDGTASREEGAHVSSDRRRLEEAKGTEPLHLDLHLSTTDQLAYSMENFNFQGHPSILFANECQSTSSLYYYSL
jgi:hypothetical protein